MFVAPLVFGHLAGELGSIFGDEDQPDVMDVREHLRDRWAVGVSAGVHQFGRDSVEEVQQDGVIAVPGVQEGFEEIVIVGGGHEKLRRAGRKTVYGEASHIEPAFRAWLALKSNCRFLHFGRCGGMTDLG